MAGTWSFGFCILYCMNYSSAHSESASTEKEEGMISGRHGREMEEIASGGGKPHSTVIITLSISPFTSIELSRRSKQAKNESVYFVSMRTQS